MRLKHEQLILITGANGFLGSEILRQALAAHMPLRATDKHAESMTSDVDYRPADILDLSSLNPLFREVTRVIHAAGLAHVFNHANTHSVSFKSINADGTANLVRAAAFASVKHFILISSVSVYGLTTQRHA